MKKLIFFTLCFTALTTFSASAKIWRVNNNTAINADYSDFQLALTNTPAGDTLYVEGSQTAYTNATNTAFCLYKKLTILGPGYFFAPSDTTLYQKNSAELALPLSLSLGADGTKIEGMKMSLPLYIGANNITISKNHIPTIYCATKRAESLATLYGIAVNNIVVSKNYVTQIFLNNGATQPTASNCILSNNIVKSSIIGYGNSTIIANNTVLSSTSWQWINAYIGGGYSWNPTENNAINVTNSIVQNNIASSILIGDTNPNSPYGWVSANNLISNNVAPNLSTTFNGGVNDVQYKVSSLGNAYKAGINGVDCGAFGGNDPYVLYGMPSMPHIYSISAPTSGTATSGIAVTIKVKSQK